MCWNYRIVRYRDGRGFGLHEVYYNDDGKAHTMVPEPISFSADAEDGPEALVTSLEHALHDARHLPIFEEPEQWPPRD